MPKESTSTLSGSSMREAVRIKRERLQAKKSKPERADREAGSRGGR
jgi:hypothetical protein